MTVHYPRLTFFTPKEWDNIAQGNALGHEWKQASQPEGLRQVLSQPFRLGSWLDVLPRALPWAKLSQSFGLKDGVPRNPAG